MVTSLSLCLIIGVSDGDTLTARCEAETVKIRVAEIDAPEKAQAFGARSKQALSDLCYKAQAEIRPVTRDRYGRTVARVSCGGQDVSVAQIQAGMAWVYRKYGTDPTLPPLESQARSDQRGLWSAPHPIPPWEWRKLPK